MSHTTTTVVTRQVTSSGGTTHVTTGNRDWNSGVLACSQDCKTCKIYCTVAMVLTRKLTYRKGDRALRPI